MSDDRSFSQGASSTGGWPEAPTVGGGPPSRVTLACAANWLDTPDAGASSTTVRAATLTNATMTISNGWYYGGYYYPYVPILTSDARPIKLTLSEVERLRKVARSDAKLKTILNKFTDLIEITVDFD